MNKEKSVIPKGVYCYTRDKEGKAIPCPYWKEISGKRYHKDGYCEYMGLGDGDILPGHINGAGEPYKLWLLWDQVKYCGVNDD